MSFRFLTIVGVSMLAASHASAQVIEPRPCAGQCPPNAECIRPLIACRPIAPLVQRTSGRVRAELSGRVVRYEVEETYVNGGGVVGEADYVLPLPKGAAFEDLAISINGEMVSGETMRAERARAVYEEIVRKLRDPALVEWMGHDLLRARIFPIQPGEVKRVLVRFRAVAEREGDALRVDWLGTRRSADSSGADAFVLRYADGGGEAFGEAYSPTHRLTVEGRNGGARTVRAEGGHGPITVLVPVRRGAAAALSLLAHASHGEDGYALVTLSPPATGVRTAPRDVVFVLDVSGSMSGRKLEQARAAGRQFLESLSPADRFRLIAFSGDVREYRAGWATATRENLRDAQSFLDGLQASGGTNIQRALETALSTESAGERLPLVLFLTDGAPTVGETRAELLAASAARLRGERRVFTFGIGADVNASLLEQLALQGRGTATFVRPDESVERAVGVVAQRLSRPVATDLRLRVDGARLYSVQPEGVLDLFAGQDLVVLARYGGAREGTTLAVEGRSADGPVRWTARVDLPAHEQGNAFVARLWAVQRVGFLSAERRRSGPNPELDDELRQLGERFGIPTELTSYLVTEPGMRFPVAQRDVRALPLDAVSAPASAAAGADAMRFEAAKTSAEQRAARTLADEAVAGRGRVDALRTAGTRTFRLAKDVWTDTRSAPEARIVRVQAYTGAYFALIQRVPELQPLFAVGERVRVHGRRVVIEVTPDGVSELDTAELDAVARDW